MQGGFWKNFKHVFHRFVVQFMTLITMGFCLEINFGIIPQLCPIRLECASIAAAASCRLSLYGFSVKTIRYDHFKGMAEAFISVIAVSMIKSLPNGSQSSATTKHI